VGAFWRYSTDSAGTISICKGAVYDGGGPQDLVLWVWVWMELPVRFRRDGAQQGKLIPVKQTWRLPSGASAHGSHFPSPANPARGERAQLSLRPSTPGPFGGLTTPGHVGYYRFGRGDPKGPAPRTMAAVPSGAPPPMGNRRLRSRNLAGDRPKVTDPAAAPKSYIFGRTTTQGTPFFSSSSQWFVPARRRKSRSSVFCFGLTIHPRAGGW